jgi:hypothetical protein
MEQCFKFKNVIFKTYRRTDRLKAVMDLWIQNYMLCLLTQRDMR